MDPNNNNSQGNTPNLQKLEDDLKTLEQQNAQTPTTSTPNPTEISPQTQTQPIMPISEPVNETIPPTNPTSEVIQNSESNQPPSTKKSSPLIMISIVLVVIALLAAVAYVVGMQFLTPQTSQKACTMEAKLCSDGSYVGRVGPNCEFEECPVPTVIPLDTLAPSATPSGLPTSTPSASPMVSPAVTPTATPSGTPI